jgi:hypothetical protein
MYITKNTGRYLLWLNMAVLIVLLISCDRSKEDKGYEYFPDMSHGFDYKTWSENPAMSDGRTMRRPADFTVPRHMQPYPYPATFEGREQAGRDLRNPLTFSETMIEDGRNLYNIFCAQCHGIQGDGQGWLFTSGKYMIQPTNLREERIVNQPSGESYHVISMGWGVMGAHASLLTPEQRWKIVSFVESVIQNKN